MRLLIVSAYPPTPPFSGGRRRIFEQLRSLSYNNHVDLACLTYDDTEEARLECLELPVRRFGIRHGWDRQPRDASGRLPELAERFWSSRLQELVNDLSNECHYDWVIAEHCYAATYTEGLSTRKALTVHNIEYRIFEQLAADERNLGLILSLAGRAGELFQNASTQVSMLKRFEETIWSHMDLCITVSETESRMISDALANPRLYAAPNCPGQPMSRSSLKPGPPGIVFMGALNYLPNVDAIVYLLRSILPLVRQGASDLDVVIAGRDPEPQLVEFCQRAQVRVVGNPDSFDDVVTSGSILVCPLRFGAGTRIKVLDAMAAGVPVVATGFAVEGLGVSAGRDFVLAESAAEFSNVVLELVQSESLRLEIAAAGHRFLRDNELRWSSVFAGLESRLRETIEYG